MTTSPFEDEATIERALAILRRGYRRHLDAQRQADEPERAAAS